MGQHKRDVRKPALECALSPSQASMSMPNNLVLYSCKISLKPVASGSSESASRISRIQTFSTASLMLVAGHTVSSSSSFVTNCPGRCSR